MVAAAVMLTVSAVLSPKKPVKRADKLQSMWPSFDGSKRKGNASKRAQTKDATIVNKGSRSSEFMRVIRSDAEFIGTATAPIRKAVADIFWLRFLEKKPASASASAPKRRDDVVVSAPPQQEFPLLSPYPPGTVSHPVMMKYVLKYCFSLGKLKLSYSYLTCVAYLSGLSSVELMMADYEALKLYINYFWHSSKVLSTPMPEIYDPQAVADYFICRPHVLGFRIIEVSKQQNLFYSVSFFLFLGWLLQQSLFCQLLTNWKSKRILTMQDRYTDCWAISGTFLILFSSSYRCATNHY